MKKYLIIGIAILIGITALVLYQKTDTKLGYVVSAPSFSESTSTVYTITASARIIATSTYGRMAYIIAVPAACTNGIYLSFSNDLPASLTMGVFVAASGNFRIDSTNFPYVGSVQASSTNQTSCNLYVVGK